MNFQQIRPRADQLRALPLPAVLRLLDARPDRHDKSKWHTSRGTLSVNGPKFINWNNGRGGGGAIDLVIHLKDCAFTEALDWLQGHFPQHLPPENDSFASHSSLALPPPDPLQLARVKAYLTAQRTIALALIDPLIQTGSLYADRRANAVFLLRSPEGSAVGAELRGTSSPQWRGMAPGSRKNLGFFCVPAASSSVLRRPIILCESAIDAISAFALFPHHWCLSSSGARPNPAWLASLIQRGATVYCGFDADPTGERMAQAMIAFHPSVQRLRPPCKDWNHTLRIQA